jgi:hypothetical protein
MLNKREREEGGREISLFYQLVNSIKQDIFNSEYTHSIPHMNIQSKEELIQANAGH